MTRDGGAAECRDSPDSRENSKEGAGLTAFAAEEERFHQGWDQVSRLIWACACAMRTFPCTAFCSNMEFRSARRAILQLLRTVAPADLPVLLEWMRTTRKRPRARGRRLGQGYFGDLRSGQKPSMESLCWSLLCYWAGRRGHVSILGRFKVQLGFGAGRLGAVSGLFVIALLISDKPLKPPCA